MSALRYGPGGPTQEPRSRKTTRGWFARRWDRLTGPTRIAGVDLARGLAVVGMLAAHLVWIGEFELADPSTWIAVVNGRSSILFATLAGVSIGLVPGGSTPLRGSALRTARLRLVVRAILLWLIGIALIVTGVPVYVILPAYALLFLLSLPFLSLGARILLPLAGAIALIMPFVQVLLDRLPIWQTLPGFLLENAVGWHYPFLVWIAFVLAGLGVARAGITTTIVQWRMLGLGAALAVIGYGLDAVSGAASGAAGDAGAGESYLSALWTAAPHSSGLLEVIGSGGFAIAVIGASLLLCRSSNDRGPGAVGYALLPLRAVGAMPLTAYVAQLVVWVIIATAALGSPGDLAGFRDLEPFWPLTIGILIACTAWALLIGRGPLEWAVERIARLAVPSTSRPVERESRRTEAPGGPADDR